MLKGRVFERYGADRGATTLADAPDRTIVALRDSRLPTRDS